MKKIQLNRPTLLDLKAVSVCLYLCLILPSGLYGHYLSDNERITLAILFYLVFRAIAATILLGIVHIFKLIVPANAKAYKRFVLVYLFAFGVPMYIMFILWTNTEQQAFTYVYGAVEILCAYFAVDFFRMKEK